MTRNKSKTNSPPPWRCRIDWSGATAELSIGFYPIAELWDEDVLGFGMEAGTKIR
jgi:hypothetical protein